MMTRSRNPFTGMLVGMLVVEPPGRGARRPPTGTGDDPRSPTTGAEL